jgi:hypothetical protein
VRGAVSSLRRHRSAEEELGQKQPPLEGACGDAHRHRPLALNLRPALLNGLTKLCQHLALHTEVVVVSAIVPSCHIDVRGIAGALPVLVLDSQASIVLIAHVDGVEHIYKLVVASV